MTDKTTSPTNTPAPAESRFAAYFASLEDDRQTAQERAANPKAESVAQAAPSANRAAAAPVEPDYGALAQAVIAERAAREFARAALDRGEREAAEKACRDAAARRAAVDDVWGRAREYNDGMGR